jgi:dTDP-4-amino-4,6-dideoxygalactose transaminase
MTVAMKKISLAEPVFIDEPKQAAVDALENDRYTKGENVAKFEEEFARYVRTRYHVSPISGTAALHIAFGKDHSEDECRKYDMCLGD